MDFDLNRDFSIFSPLLEKRSEVIPDTLREDLQKYYLPYVQKLIDLKKNSSPENGLIVGVSAIQGTGKTTQGEILEILLKFSGHQSVSQSIDDHYLTHEQLCQLRQQDPRYIRRGVTHDISLAKRDLKKLQSMKSGAPVLISGYDKGAHSGDGDRFRWVNPISSAALQIKVVEEDLFLDGKVQKTKAIKLLSLFYKGKELVLLDDMGSDIPLQAPFISKDLVQFLEKQPDLVTVMGLDNGRIGFSGIGEITVFGKDMPNGWRIVEQKPDFIFYDGWMLGARRVVDESVFDSGLPALDTPEAVDFAKMINKKLDEYTTIWDMFSFLNVLFVANYQDSIIWRDHAEEPLREKGEGMSHEQIKEFVYYFWRSVHPGIHIKNLAHDALHTQQVVIINDNHTVSEVLTPNQVKIKYP